MGCSVLELCAGGGGQAIGVEQAGFETAGAVEIEPAACATLRLNRPEWNVLESDIRSINGRDFRGVDLVAGGVPCPPFSVAGKQLGSDDERDLFPEAVRIIEEARPKAVMLENVPGFASQRFSSYRQDLFWKLSRLGYSVDSKVLNASAFGVSQLRPRFVLVGFLNDGLNGFRWPDESPPPPTVGEVLSDLMMARGWPGALAWRSKASGIAPTVVGGSKKHGGPDLGPTRARAQWRQLGVDGLGISDFAPDSTFPEDALPRLTVRMVARIQGFPDEWQFFGRKTPAYRQVGNAFPPPVARAVAQRILRALRGEAAPRYIQSASGQSCVFEE